MSERYDMTTYLFIFFALPAGALLCANECDATATKGTAQDDGEVASVSMGLLQTQIKKGRRSYVGGWGGEGVMEDLRTIEGLGIPIPMPPACENPNNPPAARRVAWFHPPKTGTSFGTTLVHYANTSLPADARMSSCTFPLIEPPSLKRSLEHPYEPHKCLDATDKFYLRYPYDIWFPGVFWHNNCDFGAHNSVTTANYDLFKGDFFALWRDPFKLTGSQYLRQLDARGYASVWGDGGLGEAQQFLADVGLDSSEDGVMALQNGSFHNLSVPSNAAALLYWSKHVQGPGSVTKMLSGHAHKADPNLNSVTEEDLHVAATRLRNGFRFVGMTDEFENSVCLFHLMFGGVCLDYAVENNRPTVTGNTTQASQLLQSMGYTDPFDAALYREARVRYASDLGFFKFSDRACHAIGCSRSS